MQPIGFWIYKPTPNSNPIINLGPSLALIQLRHRPPAVDSAPTSPVHLWFSYGALHCWFLCTYHHLWDYRAFAALLGVYRAFAALLGAYLRFSVLFRCFRALICASLCFSACNYECACDCYRVSLVKYFLKNLVYVLVKSKLICLTIDNMRKNS